MSDSFRDSSVRSTSAGSTSSSVIEFANKTFVDSTLELSKVVTVRVEKDETWPRDSPSTPRMDKTSGSDLQNFADSSEFQPAQKSSGGVAKMYVAAIVVLMFAVCMGITATYSATATVDMKDHGNIHPDNNQITWIGSLMTVGALVGSAAASFFTSLLGRKGTLMFNVLPFAIGWLVIAYAPTVGIVYIGRLITGFSTGIVSVATPMYLVEISTAKVRGLLGASFQLFVVIGVLLVSSLGALLTWRYLAISGSVAIIISGALMAFMPESPKWLMSVHKRKEAKSALTFLQGASFDAEGECQKIEDEIKNQPKGKINWREFVAPLFYKPFALSILLMFFQQFSGVNAIMFYTVDIFHSAKSTLKPTIATILVAFVQVLATVLSTVLMDRAGRKPLLIISGGCMAVSLIIFGVFDLEKTKYPEFVAEKFGWLPLVCLMTYVTAFSIGFGPAPWLMVAEMVPTRYCSFISGISTGLNWTFAFIITKSFKALRDVMEAYGVYWFYSFFCLISTFMTHYLLPETKGKSIEDITAFFTTK